MILDRLIFIVMFISLSSGTIWAKDDLLIQDVRARAAAGNGLHLSQGASSTLHNPANIVKTKSSDIYAEISLSSIDYQYNPAPEGEKAQLNTIIPPVFVGGTLRLPIRTKLALGFAPRGTGRDQAISNLPLMIEGQTVRVRAVQNDKSFRTSLGLGHRLSKQLHIGLSWLRDFDNERFLLYGDASEPTLTIENRGQFDRYIGGIRYTLNKNLSLAASYLTPLEKPYSGKTRLIQGLAEQQTTAYHYSAEEYRIGSQISVSTYQIVLDYSFRKYSQGQQKRRVGVGQFDGKARALRDTHNFGLSGTLQKKRWQLISGISWQPSIVNAGYNDEDGNAVVSGVQMNADFDYLDRLTVAAGFFKRTKAAGWGAYTSYMLGAKRVSAGSPNSGSYRLETYTVGIGRQVSL